MAQTANSFPDNVITPSAPARNPSQAEAHAQRPAPFRLLRYFSVTSLIGVLAVMAVLVFFYRHFTLAELKYHETRDNTNVTRIFASTLWPKYAEFVKSASKLSKAELQQSLEVAVIREDVLQKMKGQTAVKVKIYNLDGLTVFSTEHVEIGEDKSGNSGFRSAKAGVAVGEITFRDRFDTFEGVINHRNFVFSYVPIRAHAQAPIEGVMEVYSDITDYVERLQRTTVIIVLVVLTSLLLLYLFLFALVRRADRLILMQAREVDAANEAILRHQSRHDVLTGLPNRASFAERLDGMVKTARRARQKVAVLLINLDGFAGINDSLGHHAGDHVLTEVARRLRNRMREADVIARIGGDEFAVVISQIDGDHGVDRVASIADDVRAAVASGPIAIGEHELVITASIGISIYPDDGDDVLELVKNADAALNHARAVGRDQYQFHAADMNARALEMLVIERDLRRALEQRQFELYYQPQIDMVTGRVTGAEALIRWHHPERGLVPPGSFIPVAEERGLIGQLGVWVMREACGQVRRWREAGLPPLVTAVNVSALQFRQKDIVRQMAQVIAECNAAPDALELELTESVVMRDPGQSVVIMHELKALGLRLALDDFGTGYSSLTQLKFFPFDKLKIDQSFVNGLPGEADSVALVSAIIAMGKALKLAIIAEGVETQPQCEALCALGCTEIQGYLVARPMPVDEFEQFVRARLRAADTDALGQDVADLRRRRNS